MSITNERAADVLLWMCGDPRSVVDKTLTIYAGEEDAALAAGAAALSEVDRLRRELADLRKPVEVPDLRWPHIVSTCACCNDLRWQWAAVMKALNERGGGA